MSSLVTLEEWIVVGPNDGGEGTSNGGTVLEACPRGDGPAVEYVAVLEGKADGRQ